MYGPRPIRFSAHWCADYSKYRGFLAGGISTASSLLPFFGTRLRRQNVNLAPTQYCLLRRLPRRRPLGFVCHAFISPPRSEANFSHVTGGLITATTPVHCGYNFHSSDFTLTKRKNNYRFTSIDSLS